MARERRTARRLDFSRTPVCKTIWYGGLILSLVIMFVGGRELFWHSPVEIIQHPGQWLMRAVFSPFFYSSTLALCIALYLLYKFRVFERNFGTRKFSVLVLFSLFLNFVLNVCTLTLTLSLFQSNSPELMSLIAPTTFSAMEARGKKPSLSLLKRIAVLPTNGLDWLVSSLLVLYAAEVPRKYNFKVFGVRMSDKWVVYTLYVQMLLAGLPNNIVPALAGLLAGLLYNSGGLGLNEKTVGPKVSGIAAGICLPIVDPSLAEPPPPGIQLSSDSTPQTPPSSTQTTSTTTTVTSSMLPGQNRPANNDFKDNYTAIAAAIAREERNNSNSNNNDDDDDDDDVVGGVRGSRRFVSGGGGRRSGRNHRQQGRHGRRTQHPPVYSSQQHPPPPPPPSAAAAQRQVEEDEQFQRDVEEAIMSSLMDAVDSNAVETMVGMGFTEEQSREALARSGNNVEAAVGRLLGN